MSQYYNSQRTKWNIVIQQAESGMNNNFYKYPEIGNIILAGYDESSNSITGFHIYENKYSNRVINKNFFKEINCKFYNLIYN